MKTFYFPKTSTQQSLTEIVTALRTLLNCRYVAQVTAAKAIVVRDTPTRLALVEKIISDWTPSGGDLVAALEIPSGTETSTPTGVEPPTLKTIAVTSLGSLGITEVVTALRTLLNARDVAASTNSIVIQDTADHVAVAEKMVSDLDLQTRR